ncbi:cobalamin-binding protein [Sphingomonas hengshuiensis]|uniref:cobalamin-binding protein n=1 Tax=Sphingomonas hengshuiensis TaxID=1609977 RepID=UPI0005CA44D4|nr:cobalamin-binding protein [Sphingomonas hengshuiensis]
MTEALRIVSLLPSATEVAVALGLGDSLVGRSHECDFPRFVADLPVCTATKLEKGLRSVEIDRRVQEIVRQGLSVYEVHAELLRSLKPDVILTQTQCAICAVTPADLEESLCDWAGTAPALISLAPDTLGDVWDDFRHVAKAVGRVAEGEKVIAGLQARLAQIRTESRRRGAVPRVAAIEWFDPLMAAGNWVPELIACAGGDPLFVAPGEHSPWLDWGALVATDPDVIVMMPCGYQIPQSLADIQSVIGDPRWNGLSAVRKGHVFLADGHHFFNRPGPRLVESAAILAEIFDVWAQGGADSGEGWMRVTE